MSVSQTVQVTINWGRVTGKDAIARQLHRAILRGIKRAIDDVELKAKEIVPQSEWGDYPRSYRSEDLLGTWIQDILSSYSQLKTNSIQNPYILEDDWNVSYAEYVDEMRNVQWSKPGSRGGFIDFLHLMLVKLVNRYVAMEIAAINSTATSTVR